MEEIKSIQNKVENKQPCNIEAEQALLGSILVNNDIIDEISNTIKSYIFFDPAHIKIYDVIVNLNNRGMIANPITLKNFFEKDNMLNEVGGTEYLVKLTRFSSSSKQAVDYAKIIHEMYLRRQLILISDKLSSETLNASSKEQNAESIIEGTEKSLFDLAERGSFSQSFIQFNKALDQTIQMATLAMQNDQGIVGVPTGLSELDEKLGGLHKSDLIILAGRPSMGKTALATNIAFNAAYDRYKRDDNNSAENSAGAVVGFFSLEMSAEQLAARILSEQTEIASDKIRKGLLTNEEFDKLVVASQTLHNLPIYIDDTPALSVGMLRTRARRLKREHDLGLVVVDYLQLMESAGKSDNRVQEIASITRGLKTIAKELNVPVLALSQLSRAVEQREDKRPQLSDLRESGTIEQDADVVAFIFREAYYLERTQPIQRQDELPDKYGERLFKWEERLGEVRNQSEIIVAKQRHGPTGVVKLYFDGTYTRFGDLDLNHVE